jgi:hypothetical protein
MATFSGVTKHCELITDDHSQAQYDFTRGGFLLPVILIISIVLGLIPLVGIAWIVATGTLTTTDGLFESLIMLSISGIFFLNVFWELRDRGLLGKNKTESPSKPAASDEG